MQLYPRQSAGTCTSVVASITESTKLEGTVPKKYGHSIGFRLSTVLDGLLELSVTRIIMFLKINRLI